MLFVSSIHTIIELTRSFSIKLMLANAIDKT